ncbi:hypothetical protein Tco_0110577 [Tanacetum coccineum]
MTNASSLVDLKTLHKTDDQGPCNVTQSLKLAYVPAGSRNRPTSVPAGWHNPAAKPMTRPKSHYFQQFSRPGSYNQMDMDGGRWRTAVKTSAGCSWQSNRPYMHWGSKNNDNPHTNKDLGIVDSGCSRSMTGNKEKLADFVKIKGGTVTFGGGDGKITGKGTIRTSNFNFENVYYVEDFRTLIEFQLPDSSRCSQESKETQFSTASVDLTSLRKRKSSVCWQKHP